MVQKVAHCCVTTIYRLVAEFHESGVQASLTHALNEPVVAVDPRDHLLRSRDRCDLRVAEAREVLHRTLGSLEVVDGHPADVIAVRYTSERHHGKAAVGNLIPERIANACRDQDDARGESRPADASRHPALPL